MGPHCPWPPAVTFSIFSSARTSVTPRGARYSVAVEAQPDSAIRAASVVVQLRKTKRVPLRGLSCRRRSRSVRERAGLEQNYIDLGAADGALSGGRAG